MGRQDAAEKAKVVNGRAEGFANARQVEALPDDAGDVPQRYRFIGNAVISGSGGSVFEDQTEEVSGIEPVHGRPTVKPVTHIHRGALFACDGYKARNKAVVPIARDGGRQAHQHRSHAARRQRQSGLLRRDAMRRPLLPGAPAPPHCGPWRCHLRRAACSGDGARTSSCLAWRPGSIRQSTSSRRTKWWNSAASAWPAARMMMVQPIQLWASPTR